MFPDFSSTLKKKKTGGYNKTCLYSQFQHIMYQKDVSTHKSERHRFFPEFTKNCSSVKAFLRWLTVKSHMTGQVRCIKILRWGSKVIPTKLNQNDICKKKILKIIYKFRINIQLNWMKLNCRLYSMTFLMLNRLEPELTKYKY